MRADGHAIREGSVRERPRNPVGLQRVTALEPPECDSGRTAEASVDRARPEPVATKPELEYRDVPADRPDAEVALSEQRAATRAERAARLPIDLAVRLQALFPLKHRERVACPRADDPVDGAGMEPVRAEGDLDAAMRALALTPSSAAKPQTATDKAEVAAAKRRMSRPS